MESLFYWFKPKIKQNHAIYLKIKIGRNHDNNLYGNLKITQAKIHKTNIIHAYKTRKSCHGTFQAKDKIKRQKEKQKLMLEFVHMATYELAISI